MGTRADFYIGRGESAEWLGSIAWDGYPEGITPEDVPEVVRTPIQTLKLPRHKSWPEGQHLFDATTREQFVERLELFFLDRDDVTRPAQGWPWPWEDSGTTDFAYAFDDGRVWTSPFGHGWFDPREPLPDEAPTQKVAFPNMKERSRVVMSGSRSGLIVVTSAGVE